MRLVTVWPWARHVGGVRYVGRMRTAEPDWSRWQRPRPTAAQRRRDVWVALAVLAGALAMTVLVNSMGAFAFGSAPSLAEQFAWGAALTAPLVVRRAVPDRGAARGRRAVHRRRRSRQVGDNMVPSIALFLAIYTVGAWERNRTVARWARVGVIVAMFGWLGFGSCAPSSSRSRTSRTRPGRSTRSLAAVLYNIVFNLVFFLSAYFFGNMAWLSARRQAELEAARRGAAPVAGAEHPRRDRRRAGAHRPRPARRRRPPRVGDGRAGRRRAAGARQGPRAGPRRAADRRADRPHRDRRAARAARRAACRGRRADRPRRRRIRPRRGSTSWPSWSPPRGRPGSRSTHGVYGEPRPVPDGVALSAYRVVQEALTNVVKHAGARQADVRVRYLDNALEVEVTDDGRGRASCRTGRRVRAARHAGTGRGARRRAGGRAAPGRRLPGPRQPARARVERRASAVTLCGSCWPTTRTWSAPGFRVILGTEDDIEVVGEAGDGLAAVELVDAAAAGRRADGRPDARHRRAGGHPAGRSAAATQ